MNFSQSLNPKLIKVGLQSTEKDDLFDEMAQLLVDNYPNLNKNAIVNAVFEREKQMSTGIMTNVAIPHCRLEGVEDALVCVGVSKKGIDYGSLDSQPVLFVVLLVVSSEGSDSHLELLRNLSKIIKDDEFFERLLQLQTSEEVLELLKEYENNL